MQRYHQDLLKGKILLRLEDTEEFAHLLGKFELLYGNYKSPEEIVAEIDKVSIDDINKIIYNSFSFFIVSRLI